MLYSRNRVALSGLLAVGMALAVLSGCQPGMVTVPNVVNQPQDEAEQALRDAELTVGAVSEVFHPTIAVNHVIAQTPAAVVSVRKGAVVALTVSQGPEAEGEFESDGDHTGDLVMTLPGDVPLALVHIPAGTYMRGRYPGEQDSWSNEDPQHEVTLTQDFYLGKYTVTKGQWEAVMGTTPWAGEDYVLNDPDSPAVFVSWNDAQDFITALNTHITATGQGPATVRLPSEAEWEYACRAGTTTRFYWGDDPDYSQIGEYAWYSGNLEGLYAHVVGLKLPNPWGLYDMSGNVWEWCEDWFGEYPEGPVTDPTGPNSGSYRVIRGGSWSNYPGICRSAYRYGYAPEYRYDGLGFRLALPAVQ